MHGKTCWLIAYIYHLIMVVGSLTKFYSMYTEYNRNKLYMLYKKAKSMYRYKQKVHLVGDVLILDGKRYGVDELHNLPVELSPRQFSERINDECINPIQQLVQVQNPV